MSRLFIVIQGGFTVTNRKRREMLKEARGRFFGRGVEVVKLQSPIGNQLRSPSYYIIIST